MPLIDKLLDELRVADFGHENQPGHTDRTFAFMMQLRGC